MSPKIVQSCPKVDLPRSTASLTAGRGSREVTHHHQTNITIITTTIITTTTIIIGNNFLWPPQKRGVRKKN
jgi:hypothetical protein